MDTPQNIIEAYHAVYGEGVSEHPDVAGQPDFARRVDEILKRRKESRTPKGKAAARAVRFFDKSVIKKNVKESSCGCDAEETPSIKKDKKNKVMDAREIPTKVNLIKTKLRLMGLRMSYEPEEEMVEETKSGDKSLKDWFSKSSGTNPKTGKEVKGWTQIGGPFAGAPCARQPGQTSTPKCGSSKMASNLSDKEEDKAFERKNREDPNQPQKKNATSPTNVRTEEIELQEKEGKKDACYSKVKSRYSVWPSAYACVPIETSKALTREGWKSYKELSIGDEILTFNLEKNNLEFKPIENLHFYNDAPTYVIKNGNTGWKSECTPNHKWVVKYPECKGDRGRKKYTSLINDMQLVSIEDILNESGSNRKLVISSKYNGGTPISLNKIYKYETNWIEYLLNCSSEQRETWLYSAIVYDGNQIKTERLIEKKEGQNECEYIYDTPHNKQSFGFKQKDANHRDAFLLSAFLNNGLVTFRKNKTSDIYNCHYTSYNGTKSLDRFKLMETRISNVWCPQTENGTWVMMQETDGNGIITITGNSGALVKCRKVGAANWGTKSEESIMEKEMTSTEIKAEKKLKSKYDPSGMKASMIKQYGEEKGKQIYFATIRKKAMEEQLDYIEEKARGTRPKRTVHAYDVDETLFSHGKKGKPNVQVHVKDTSGKRVKSLSNQEFNTHKLEKGHSYDFGEFRSAKKFKETSSPNKKIIADLKRKQARGQNVHLITARSKFDKPSEFKGHLEKHGIKTPMSNIHYTGGMKGGDIGAKKVKVASAVAKKSGTKSMHMHDDAAKVHKAFEAEKKNKPTSAKIKTHMIKPNKSGEPTSRSYQATKEDFELSYDYMLEQLVLEGLAEDYDSAMELTESFDDELLGDLMREAITAIGAPAPEPKRPEKKGPRKLKPVYGGNKKLPPKKEYKEDFTPYEFWMNIIETQQPEIVEEVEEEEIEEIVKEGPTTSYDYWKKYIEENANFSNN